MTPRPRKTFADYVAIAISPLLIMVLVGSLAFFLLEIGYHGRWEGRLRWALFWFVIASVLVSRISIENGYGRASVYGLLLSGAVALLTIRLIGFSPIILGILALIWWCTAKLTWDSTLIEDEDDSSGEGLLQAGGLQPAGSPAPESGKSKRRKRLHAPGVWIVYFSLAALPLFGVGQIFLQSDTDANRRYTFGLLWIYTAAALGLLMTTSFLGLRRYLRQRFLKMPPLVSITWIVCGTAIAAVILTVCLVLPRPDSTYSVAALKDRVESLNRNASTNAIVGGDAGDGDGKRIGSGKGEGEGMDRKGGETGKESNVENQGAKQPESGAKPGGDKSGEAQGKSGSVSQDGNDGSTTASNSVSANQPTPTPSSTNDFWKWLIIGVVGLALLVAGWFFRMRLLQLLEKLIGMWRSLWNRLFQRNNVTLVATAAQAPARPFADYRNPFITGAARTLGTDELVRYTFEALQAWAKEKGCPRSPEQTPREFSTSLGSTVMPGLAEDLEELGGSYTRFAYASQSPDADCLPAVERVWQHLEKFRNS